MVNHRIHVAGGYAETQAQTIQGAKRRSRVPVCLRDDAEIGTVEHKGAKVKFIG